MVSVIQRYRSAGENMTRLLAGELRPALRPRALRTSLVAGILLIPLAGCAEATADAESRVAIRDSSGVRIVENGGHAWADGEGWRIAEVPELDIGVVEGDSVYQLFRVTAATRLRDGRIAVANAGTSEIRIYDERGRFLAATGRAGEGPGEFRALHGLWPYRADSLLAWDATLRRITIIDRDGANVRQAVLQAAPGNPFLLPPFDDGAVALGDERYEISGSGVQEQFMEVTRHAPDGALVDSVGRYRFAATIVIGSGGDALVGSPGFSARTSIERWGDEIAIGYGFEPEILSHAADGTLVRRVRWPDQERSVTEEDIATYRAERLHGITDENRRRSQLRYLERIPWESRFPVYDRFVADRAGRLWVRRFPRPGTGGSAAWLVIDGDGRTLGEVTAPSTLRILEIGDDYLLAVERDHFHVEHVRLYRIEKDR